MPYKDDTKRFKLTKIPRPLGNRVQEIARMQKRPMIHLMQEGLQMVVDKYATAK